MDDAHSLIDLALLRFTVREVAEALGVEARTVRRWHTRETDPPRYVSDAIRQRLLPIPAVANTEAKFRFIDLFAGIGGMRIGFEKHGGECVFTSEWDAYARRTYSANFHDDAGHIFAGDITAVHEDDVPDHDVLLAG